MQIIGLIKAKIITKKDIKCRRSSITDHVICNYFNFSAKNLRLKECKFCSCRY